MVIVTGVFSYYQENKSSRIMESFKNMVPQVDKMKIAVRHIWSSMSEPRKIVPKTIKYKFAYIQLQAV